MSAAAPSVRVLAWEALHGSAMAPSRELAALADAHALSGPDRGLLRQLVLTEVRRRGTLRALLAAFAHGKPARELAFHLHLGLVQLLFLDRVPPHAALSETVDAVRATLGEHKAGYTNAVLRTVLRERREGSSGDPRRDIVERDWHFEGPIFADPLEHPLLWAEDALSLPASIYKIWLRRHGSVRASELARLALHEPWLSLRVVRGEREVAEQELAARGAAPVRSAHERVLLVPPQLTEAALGSEAFAAGRLSVQGECALRAAEAVEARAGERVLDLCAAPGGKTAVLAASGANVLACDVEDGKLERARETLQRLGLLERVELMRLEPGEVPPGSFDAVLIDAPCSNTGVLAARPEARWRHGPAALRSLTELQGALIEKGASRVRPGGRLIWSTCSLDPQENERVVRSFLERHREFELRDEHTRLPAPPPGPVDGGYAARLVRRSGS